MIPGEAPSWVLRFWCVGFVRVAVVLFPLLGTLGTPVYKHLLLHAMFAIQPQKLGKACMKWCL